MRILLALVLSSTLALAAGENAISHSDLVAAIKADNVILIDVNGTETYTKVHIPGALDFAAVKGSLSEHLPEDKDSLIVAYCANPKCGAWKRGAKAAKALGYTNVKHYKPGIVGWIGSPEGKATLQQ